METKPIKDMNLAAFLMAVGQPMRRHEWWGNVCYYFDDSEATRRLVDDYWRGTATVGGRAFAEASRTLKDLIHN